MTTAFDGMFLLHGDPKLKLILDPKTRNYALHACYMIAPNLFSQKQKICLQWRVRYHGSVLSTDLYFGECDPKFYYFR